MTLERIHIKNRGPLVGFKAEFAPITVIYGPNASGKSLLSNTLRAIERGEELETGEAIVTFNDRTLTSADFANVGASNRIRVFNADFLRDDVIDGDPSAIVLGSEVNNQRIEIERLGEQVANLGSHGERLIKDKERLEKSLGDKRQAAGEYVRTVLKTVPRIEGANSRWDSYNRGDARECFKHMLRDGSATRHHKTSDELEELAEAIRQRTSNLLDRVHLDDPEIPELHQRAMLLLQSKPNAGSLPEVDNDPVRRDWLLKGHTYATTQGHCAYCHQVVPPDRAENLDSFFSQDMTKLLDDIDDLVREINQLSGPLRSVSSPQAGEVRGDLQNSYRDIRARWIENVDSAKSALATIKSCLESKKRQPAIVVEMDAEPFIWDTEATNEVNRIVDEHNQAIDDLLRVCHEFEFGVIANRLDEWKRMEDEIADLKLKINANNERTAELTANLNELKRSADTRLIAAEELTKMVRSFLGHDEVGFELNEKDHSYRLTRHGEPAKGFSEGERTALALMYFLKRLEDDSFDKQKGTLVFDDPITSFDEDNLYRAVADIVTMTGIKTKGHALKECKVVFLTHHFGLFERLWMELTRERRSGDAKFYELRCLFEGNQRKSTLIPLKDTLITDYLLSFQEVKSIADGRYEVSNPETSLRKCIEGFVTRMAPGAIDRGLSVAYWSFVKGRNPEAIGEEDLQLIISIANAGSHLSAIPRPAHTERHRSTLTKVSSKFLKLMEHTAPEHYDDLKKWHERRVKLETNLEPKRIG